MNILNRFKHILATDFLVRNIVLAVSFIVLLVVITSFALSVFTRHGQKHRMPDFKGMSMEEANRVASKNKLVLEVIDSLYVPSKPKGIILEQYPKQGNFVKSGRKVFITTTTFTPKMVPVPYVVGFSLRQAKNKIVGSNLEIGNLTYKQDIATNNIIGQRYKGKSITNGSVMGESGSEVELIVGYNPVDPNPTVPNIIGLNIEQAKNKLWESGFNVGVVEFDNVKDMDNEHNAMVFEQSVMMNTQAMYGRAVSFGVTNDKQKVDRGIKSQQRALEAYLKEQETNQDLDTLLQ